MPRGGRLRVRQCPDPEEVSRAAAAAGTPGPVGSRPAPPREDFLGRSESDVKTRCGTRVLGWKCSPCCCGGQLPARDLIFGGSLVPGLPAPSLRHPPTATGPLGLGAPGLPTSGLSQRSSGSSGSSVRAEGTGTVPPRRLPWDAAARPGSRGFPQPPRPRRHRPDPPCCLLGVSATNAWKTNSGFKGRTSASASLFPSVPSAGPRSRTTANEAGKAGEPSPPAAGFPPSCRPREAPERLPGIRASSSSSSTQPCPTPGPTSAAPGLYKACSSAPAGLQCPRQPGPPRELPAGTV